ncbi:hypothetical protein [Roseospirillum parvum]|uniref:Uncharacterized protein n=1 Tax=Roseospirillum parvum TaxID=83401 RepID=A0A1G7TN39_9PROT|nr:hypothetical protein [Roseospirillum parvum]SDG36522.1 hypothetical protein SAMN05421742_10146 [Roseospirillum parvum]
MKRRALAPVVHALIYALVALAATGPAAHAQSPQVQTSEPGTIDPATEYARCLALARSDPEAGFDRAGAWEGLGGGDAARHCAAVALLEMGEARPAARRLELLAEQSRQRPEVRAGMLAQAAQGWLLDANPGRAVAALDSALALLAPDAPARVDLLIDRAVALAEAANYRPAVDDLSAALALDPRRVDALTLRASARRFLDDTAGARADIDAALELDRFNPDALLERGILNRLAGDAAAARDDWLAVVNIAPDSAAAELARANLARLDVDQP